jgi:hypothetical protein
MPVIFTTHGELEESTLRKVEGVVDNDHECTRWIEYYLGDELVHRSVHVTLKEWPEGFGALADLQ